MEPQTEFVSGQRWISHTEAELGLGIVIEVANRRVELSFPSAAERRVYATDNAPLGRVIYPIDDKVKNDEGLELTITDRQQGNGCVIYLCEDADGQEVVLHEMDLDSFVHFSKPQDRLFAGQVDKVARFELRQQTLQFLHQHQQSPACGLLGGRVQLLPHQLYIASRVGVRHAPRVLLADEVGLGKTIEAGLILHQQLYSGRASRVLIAVPDSLVHQWLVEMLRRFNLHFTILDQARCEALEQTEEEVEDSFADELDDGLDDEQSLTPSGDVNPFETAQLVLCSTSFLSNNQRRHSQALAAGWDMLIVDEAHHLAWSEEQASPAYQCIEALAARIPSLLLLTATPEQLGVAGHFARLRLLDPDRYYDLPTFVEEESRYQAVSELVQSLQSGDALGLDAAVIAQVSDYLGATAAAELQATQQTVQEGGDEAALSALTDNLVQDLLDRHGTGRVLFRNTREAVEGFPQRHLQGYALPNPVSSSPGEDEGLQSEDSLLTYLQPERLLGEDWLLLDPRVAWLVDWLAEHRQEKVLVICAQSASAQALEEYLRVRQGVRSGVFHEGMSLIARDRSAAYFADEQDSAQTLICSEIGSEGRNFQFAHHLVLFDLPINPDLLEQRIGRLDRIGQRQDVQIHVPYHEGSAQEVMLRWYSEGLAAFQRVCPVGLSIYQQVAEQLHHCLRSPGDSDALTSLVEQSHQLTETALEAMQKGRDRLLEMNSCNTEVANEVIDAMLDAEQSSELEDYLSKVFDEFGIEQSHHSADSIVVMPSDHMLAQSLPGLPEDGLTATYSRRRALSREDMRFFTWEHPLVVAAMEQIANGDFGSTSVCTLKLSPLKPGTLLFEGMFTVYCPAPKVMQLGRYLPQSVVRVVVDESGKDLSQILTTAHFAKLCQRVKRRTAVDMVGHVRTQVDTLVAHAEAIAETQQTALITEAQRRMAEGQNGELQRLQALAAVNPSIRSEEIDYLRESMALSQDYLANAQLKLDALRLIVVV
ncbi:MAG: RNA polymerase-associated protein RapA [Gammaproteobacteria bacterium]|nr:RNA polymerase-associated protein RapA [Gammaproteobacteria bacterium]MBQ0841034.1 RNA polymerase-associated protein RapA [Gammaproteobacteria bacterium]